MAQLSEDTARPLARLREVLAPEQQDLWVILLYVAVVGILALIVPVTTQALVNTAAFGALLQPMVVLSVLVLLVLGAAGVLRVMQVSVAERLQQRIFARMAIDVAHRLPRVRLEVFDRIRGTELVNRFFDVLTIQKSTALILLDGTAIVLQTAIGLFLLALYHPLLLAFAILLLSSMLFVVFGLGRKAIGTSVAESHAKYHVVAWLEELARVPLPFRLSGGGRLALQRADAETVEYLTHRKAHFRILLRQIIGTVTVQAVAGGLLLGLGAVLVVRQQLTLGQLVAAELIVTPAVASFAKFGKYLETFYELLAGVEKVSHLFDLPLERADGSSLPGEDVPLRAELRAVSSTRHGRIQLDRVTLDVRAGERVAVFGPRESGKSVLTELLAGDREPTDGTVALEGIDTRSVETYSLHDRVALVRGGELFDGTVRDNLELGRQDVGPLQVANILDRLGVRQDLEQLPEGLDTDVGGTLRGLSSRQALLVALARAALGRPGLMIIDGTLDGLDAESRHRALNVLLDPQAPWTLVLTTSSPPVATAFDRIVRIEGGHIFEGDEARP